MSKTYAVLGAGMQGTACAYDLARFANPSRIFMADRDLEQAKKNSRRVNDLVGQAICEPKQVDALDAEQVRAFLDPIDIVASCLPYWMHPKVAKIAIETSTHMVDLGGNTEISMETLAMDEQAKAKGVTIVPDCGLAPGLVNNLGCYLIEHLDTVESVKLYCGVLPQNPKPPFNYKLTFNIEGLLTEYDFQAVVLRNNEIALVETLDELEKLFVEELGEMEAFTTSGGTSTAPYTFKGRVANYEYKTIRFPGHCRLMRIFKDFGFWSFDEVEVGGCRVKPREVFYKVFGDQLSRFEDKDMCVVRAIGVGQKDGQRKELQIDIFDREDDVTKFTSMERLTGFSQAIYAHEIGQGNMEPGCLRYETAMTGTKFVEEIQKRGVQLRFS